MAPLMAGVFLISFSLLSLEITFARVLSVMLSYHYVFLTISLALMGLGTGSLVVYFLSLRRPNLSRTLKSVSLQASVFSLSIPVSTLLIIFVGHIEKIQNSVLLYCIILFLPFFLGGMIFAEIFRLFPSLSSWLYGADLAGAAAAVVGVVLALNIFGGVATPFLLAIAASTASLFFAAGSPGEKRGIRLISYAAILTTAFLFGANLKGCLPVKIPVGANRAKEIHEALSGPGFKGKILETRWSAFGRTDLVEFEGYADQMQVYLDGTAGSPMYKFSGDIHNPDPAVNNLKLNFSGYFPFLFFKQNERDDALIIGPGGGRDLLLALLGGVKKITAVEVNKELVDIVRQYSWYNGGIYARFENIDIVVDEGRNFLKRQKKKYDLILLSLPITATSRSLEGYALTENYLFTTDSIKDYLNHLTDEGHLVIVCHGDVETSRLFSITISALREMGIETKAAMEQIYMLGSDKYPVFVLRKTAFDPEVASLMYDSLKQFGVNPDSSYFPYQRKKEVRKSILTALGDGRISLDDFEKKIKELGYDISPVTDNRPFFYKFELGMPKPVARVFFVAFLLVLLVLCLPLIYGMKDPFSLNRAKFIVFFSLLGLGFMLVEISLIQRFVLFLGQPVLSMAVILISLLAGAGAGSLASARVASNKLSKRMARASLSVLLSVLTYSAILPFIFNHILGLSISFRLIIASLLLIPLGFFMGFPFPLGIKALKEVEAERFIPWMWAINGTCSVLGSVMAIMIGIKFGFSQAFLAGGCCYLVVFLLFLKPKPLRA